MKSKLALVLVLVVAGLAALLVAQSKHSETQRAKLEELQVQVEKLSEQARTSVGGSEALPASAVTEKPPLDPVENSAPAPPAPRALAPALSLSEPNRPAPGGMAGVLGNMLKDPEMRKALAQQQKLGLNMAYGGLFKQLQLTPEQEEKFKDVLLEQQMAGMSQAGAMMGNPEDRAELTKQITEQQKQRETQMKELLGEEKFTQFQEYNQTLGERMMLDQFGKDIQTTPEQHEQLLAIMKEEKQNAQINSGRDLTKPENIQAVLGSPDMADKMVTQQEQVNARVIERASEVLTPEQVRKLEPVLKTQIEMQRASMKMAREMFGGQKNAPEQ